MPNNNYFLRSMNVRWKRVVLLVLSLNLIAWTTPEIRMVSTMSQRKQIFPRRRHRRRLSVEQEQQSSLPRMSTGHDNEQQQTEELSLLPPVHVNSSWIGNRWYPPKGYRLYNANEMKDFFQKYSMLWVGDSTARRAYATLYSILNATSADNDSAPLSSPHVSVHAIDDTSILNVNKKRKNRTEPCLERPTMLLCRSMPLGKNNDGKDLNHTVSHHHNYYDFRWNMCPDRTHLDTVIQDYNLVVVSTGPWELVGRCGKTSERWKRFRKFLDKLIHYTNTTKTPRTHIVFRTLGNCGDAPENNHQNYDTLRTAQELNQQIVRYIDRHNQKEGKITSTTRSTLSYVHFGAIILPHRSYPDQQRIRGDIPPHYGWQARMAFLQMLMNHLKEQEKRLQLV